VAFPDLVVPSAGGRTGEAFLLLADKRHKVVAASRAVRKAVALADLGDEEVAAGSFLRLLVGLAVSVEVEAGLGLPDLVVLDFDCRLEELDFDRP